MLAIAGWIIVMKLSAIDMSNSMYIMYFFSPFVPEVIYERSPRTWKVPSSFSTITFDRDMLEQCKYLRGLQVDKTNRLIYNMIRFSQVMTLTLRSNFQTDLSRSKYVLFDTYIVTRGIRCWQLNVVPFLSQELLPKTFVVKITIFRDFTPWRLRLWWNPRSYFRNNVKRGIECVFLRRYNSSGSRVTRLFVEKC